MGGVNGQTGGKNRSSTFVLTHSFPLADLTFTMKKRETLQISFMSPVEM
jgi:hypothetical protein